MPGPTVCAEKAHEVPVLEPAHDFDLGLEVLLVLYVELSLVHSLDRDEVAVVRWVAR